jgi:hypothetical protein
MPKKPFDPRPLLFPMPTLLVGAEGEIVEVYVNEDCLTEGRPDMGKIDPISLQHQRSPVQAGGRGHRAGVQGGQGQVCGAVKRPSGGRSRVSI